MLKEKIAGTILVYVCIDLKVFHDVFTAMIALFV